MNEAKDFLREGILIESSLITEFSKLKISLPQLARQTGATFLSKKDLPQFSPKFVKKLEQMKNLHEGEERKNIEAALEYFKTFMPKSVYLQVERKDGASFKIINSWNLPPRKITVDDFTKYFQARLTDLKKILQDHGSLTNLTSIGKISAQKQDLSIIGMINEKRTTKNKNVILEMEDLSGKMNVLIHNSRKELIEKAKEIVQDEVIGIRGNGNNEIIFVNDIAFPEISGNRKNLLSEESYAVFTSDTHIGSKKFIEDKFLNFISWVNGEIGNDEQKALSKKIKYLFIVGDTVDGIGVFPNQSDFLDIKDIKLQYKKLAEHLGKIRKDIIIFISPGQHDATRIAEPQPPIDREYAEDLYQLENAVLLSNPAMVEIGTEKGRGIKVLMYHGASFHSMIDDIEELRLSKAHDNPTKVSKHLLRKRHLAPQHSTTDHLPVPEMDPLVIREIPDVFASGDLHRPDVDFYGSTTLIASSCWQHRTEFEEKVGNNPDPCKVPILNLKTGKVSIIDFS